MARLPSRHSQLRSAVRRCLYSAVGCCSHLRLIAFATAIPVGLTGIFLVLFSGYCEDVGYCSPKWWVFVGFALLGVAIVLGGLMGRAIRDYRRVA